MHALTFHTYILTHGTVHTYTHSLLTYSLTDLSHSLYSLSHSLIRVLRQTVNTLCFSPGTLTFHSYVTKTFDELLCCPLPQATCCPNNKCCSSQYPVCCPNYCCPAGYPICKDGKCYRSRDNAVTKGKPASHTGFPEWVKNWVVVVVVFRYLARPVSRPRWDVSLELNVILFISELLFSLDCTKTLYKCCSCDFFSSQLASFCYVRIDIIERETQEATRERGQLASVYCTPHSIFTILFQIKTNKYIGTDLLLVCRCLQWTHNPQCLE